MLRTYYPPLVDETTVIELSPAQAIVLDRALAGHGNPRIATDLHYSVDTVKSHMRKIMLKAGATSRAHLTALVYSGTVRVLVPVGESFA